MRKTWVVFVVLVVGGVVALRMFNDWEISRDAIPLAAKYCDPKTPALSRKLSSGVDLTMAQWHRKRDNGLFNRASQWSATQRIQVIQRAIDLAQERGCFRISMPQR